MAIVRRHNGTEWEAIDVRNLDGISDGTITITPDKIGLLSDLQTTNNDNLVNAINEVKQTAGNNLVEELDEDDRQIKRLLAYEQTKGRVLGGSGVFVNMFDGVLDPIMQIDTTKTNATSTLSAGNTTIPVKSTAGFSIGQEITVFDDVNLERPTITGISGNNIQVTALTKSYKNNATVCRSSVVVDTVNKCLKFGGWNSLVTNNVFSTVVGSNYSLVGNGGRKIVKLNNGWLISVVQDYTNSQAKFEVSKDNGSTWVQLTYISTASSNVNFALTCRDSYCYFIATFGTSAISLKFDALTVSNSDQWNNRVQIDSQTSFGSGCSLAITSDGTLHAAWSSKNSTYPNSFNIRYAKSTDGGNTWSSVEQVTTTNVSGIDNKNPCILFSNSKPVIIVEMANTNSQVYQMQSQYKNGSSWTQAASYLANTSYAQSNPCVVVDGNGTIHCWWHGKDSTDSSKFNIRYSKSTDGGVTWTASVKLTSGNVYDQMNPTATFKNSNQITVLWEGRASGTYNQIRKITSSDGGNTWSSITDVTSQTTAHASNPSALLDPTLDFTEPLFIYQDGTNVKFKGTWSVGTNVPVKVEDLRYNLTSPTGNLSEIVSFVQRSAEMYNEYVLNFTEV